MKDKEENGKRKEANNRQGRELARQKENRKLKMASSRLRRKMFWENLNKQTTGMGRQKRTRKRMGKGKKRLIDEGEDQKGRKETWKLTVTSSRQRRNLLENLNEKTSKIKQEREWEKERSE